MRVLRARHPRRAAGGGGGGGVGRAPQPGPHGRPLRADPHLQLPREPDQRPPHRLQGLQPRPGARRRARADRAVRDRGRRGRPPPRPRRVSRRAPEVFGTPQPSDTRPCTRTHDRLPPRRRTSCCAPRSGICSSPGARPAGRRRAAARPRARHEPGEGAGGRADRRHGADAGRRAVPRARAAARPPRAAAAPDRAPPGSGASSSPSGPGVFVPRPETEVLVEHALLGLPEGGRAVDLGTGSGAIALAIAHERPDAAVVGVERSPEAFAWADRNRERLGVANARIVLGDLAGRGAGVGRHGRRRRLEPALRPGRHGPEGPGGAAVRPACRALRRPGRPRPDARGRRDRAPRCCVRAACSPSSTASCRARTSARCSATAWEDAATHPDLTGRDRVTPPASADRPATATRAWRACPA